MEKDALLLAQEFTQDYSIKVADSHEAHLLIEVDGFDTELLMKECEQIINVLENFEKQTKFYLLIQKHKNTLWNSKKRLVKRLKVTRLTKKKIL